MNYELQTLFELRNSKGFQKKLLLFFLVAGQLLTLLAYGKNRENNVLTAQQQESALYLDFISIPCPGESFAAINKVSRPNWAALTQVGNIPVTTNRAQLALAVGVLITNGYIAVEAQDGQQVKNIGRDIVTMSKALGVSQSILSRGNNLIEFADHNQWEALRDELEATENEVKTTMVEQRDHNLVTLTSAAAWIRGLEIASTIILNHYSERGASLLYESELARHLVADLNLLPEKLRNDPLVIRVNETLVAIAGLLEKERHGLSKEDLLSIQKQTSEIVAAIDASPSGQSVMPTPSASVSQEKKSEASSTREIASLTPNDATPTFAEAKQNAFNLAGALVNDGFRIRDGDWMVTLTPKKTAFLQVTFFAGNQYWFAAAGSPPAHSLKLTVYDAMGHVIPLDTWHDDGSVTGARAAGGLVAPHSGRYFVGLELLDSKENGKADICLIYAYK